jgi:hypothetical protein
MSSTRRILLAGLPAAGVTVFAALALNVAPAMAAGDTARPAAMTTPCGDRTTCAYGTPGAANGGYTHGGTKPAATTTGDTAPGATTPATTPVTAPATATTSGSGTHTRGHGGYGNVSPSTTPTSPTPTGNTDTVPPGGVSPSSASPSASSYGGGVSAGHALPVTGAPMGAIVSVGGMLVAAGAASIWYTRRRRSA